MAKTRKHNTIREGILNGMIGATAVAIWFFVLDVAQGRLLFTPAALGSGFLLGARGLNEVEITVTTVLGYSLVHGVAFVAVGTLAAMIIHAAEKRPVILLGGVLIFVTLEVLFVGLLVVVASWLIDVLHWTTIAAANLIAGLAMGIYLFRTHPGLKSALRRDLEEDEAHMS
jgi:hypothetical protein